MPSSTHLFQAVSAQEMMEGIILVACFVESHRTALYPHSFAQLVSPLYLTP